MSKEEIINEFDKRFGGVTTLPIHGKVNMKIFLSDSLDRIEAETRKQVGIEFWKWFHGKDYELVEDAIPRITGVEYMTEKQFKAKYGIQETEEK